MWIRGILGVVCCLVGVVWILQGTNVVHGSNMSGHGVYALLGVVVFIVGVVLLEWARRVRSHQPS